jgi:DNA excision repair protein ERCC-2
MTAHFQQRGYWSDIFPFDPYQKQVRGINEAIDALQENGLYLLEGACGTGKTLMSLTAGLSLVRDRDTKFQRLLVVTSKKQQLRAFEDDLKAINGHTDQQFEGLSLVGKSDVCPYVQTGHIDQDEIYHRCLQLRENMDRIMSDVVDEGKADRRVDAALGLAARVDVEDDPFEEQMSVAGVDTPYTEGIPEVQDEEYCPFYAEYFVNDYQDQNPVKIHHGTTARETLRNGAKLGTCPHAAMKQMVDDGHVLIGNYSHVFSPQTVESFTGGMIDESTILIVDEAHEMVNKVRDELSYSVTMETLRYAIRDVDMVLKWLNGKGHGGKVRIAKSIVDKADYEQSELKGLRWFLSETYDLFADEIDQHLTSEYGSGWEDSIMPESVSDDSISIQRENGDLLDDWVQQNGVESDWTRALHLGYAVAYIRQRIMKKIDRTTPEGDLAIERVRELLNRWLIGNYTEYFRELKLNTRHHAKTDEDLSEREWQRAYRAEIRVNNCIPQDEIAGTLDLFGGAIVMSATLAPLDVYKEVTGIRKLKHGAQPSDTLVSKAVDRYEKLRNGGQDTEDDVNDDEDEEEERTPPEERARDVSTSVFGMDFPEENRASIAVNAPKFTWTERWPPEENQSLRSTYRNVLTDVATTTPGNVLVFMPSYQEAEWAADILENAPAVDKPVLADESSSDATTEQLKEEFFDGGGKILATGLRGTLTEGVDFDGDKLDAAVICGVPISNTGTELANAIQNAYSSRFGDWLGFQYAFTVPAVRKTRQALGRVIRGDDDVGVRVLVDKRYTDAAGQSSVLSHFPDYSREEFRTVEPDGLERSLQQFWSQF